MLSGSAGETVLGIFAATKGIVVPLGCGYALVCALAFAAQRKLQYFPSEEWPDHPKRFSEVFSSIEVPRPARTASHRPRRRPPSPLAAQEHEVFAADGTRCLLWHWPAPEPATRPAAPMWLQGGAQESLQSDMSALRREYADLRGKTDVLLLHGNAGNRQTRLLWMYLLREGLGVSVTVLDYRGYGGSDGPPPEACLIADGVAAVRWLSERRKLAESTGAASAAPVVWGESIGCGVAVAIAAEEPASALVLEAGCTPAADLGKHAYPFLPVKARDSIGDSFSIPSRFLLDSLMFLPERSPSERRERSPPCPP